MKAQRTILASLSLLLVGVRRRLRKGGESARPARRRDASFLEGTWSGTLTIRAARSSQRRHGPGDMDVRNRGRDEPAVVQGHDSVAARLAADHHDRDQCDHAVEPAARSHQHTGRVPVTAGMHGHVAQRRQCRDPDDRGGLLRRRLLVAAELHVHRTCDADQDGMIADGV